jgi:hypothetical protein
MVVAHCHARHNPISEQLSAYLRVSIPALCLCHFHRLQRKHSIKHFCYYHPNNTQISSIWEPRSGMTWYIVLPSPPTLPKSGSDPTRFNVYIGLFDNPASIISEIHNLYS